MTATLIVSLVSLVLLAVCALVSHHARDEAKARARACIGSYQKEPARKKALRAFDRWHLAFKTSLHLATFPAAYLVAIFMPIGEPENIFFGILACIAANAGVLSISRPFPLAARDA